MRKATATLTFLVVALAMAATAFAQQPGPRGQGGPGGPGGQRWDPAKMEAIRKDMEAARTKVINGLGLSAEQKTKVDALEKKFKEDREKLQKEAEATRGTGDREAMMENRRKQGELMQKHQQDFNAILTQPQRQTYMTRMGTELDAIAKKHEIDPQMLRRMMMGGQRGQGQRPGGPRPGAGV